MAGPIQSALSSALTSAAAAGTVAKKAYEDEKQAVQEESDAKVKEAKAAEAYQKEAKATALTADLIKMGADPESAKAFINAKELGLDTKGFGMIRQKGRFVGSYSSLAEKLSKDSLTDSMSARLVSQKGFADRLMALGGSREERVDKLLKASKGGSK